MKKETWLVWGLITVLFLSSYASAEEYDMIIVNSEDWQDVYSAAMHANLKGKNFNFLSSNEQAMRLPAQLNTQKILLIESEKKPVTKGYKTVLEAKGFTVIEQISQRGEKLNLELAEKLDTRKYVIVDDTYGYNALSVLPYAVASKSYVLFADKENIGELSSFLKNREPELLTYGHLDPEVVDALEIFEPETIDSGDIFDDNIEIVDRYRKLKATDQVTLTDGSFMELGLMRGTEPILYLGRDSVPPQVSDYVSSSGIRVGVLVGNHLISNAQSLKAKTGISVFLKFGQGTGSGAGSASIRDLDYYPLPEHPLNVSVREITYNGLTDELEVLYLNNEEAYAYLKPSIRLYSGNQLVQTVGETEAFIIEGGGQEGRTYTIDSSGGMQDLRAEVFLQYGEGRKSLDRTYEKDFRVESIEVEDSSKVGVVEVTYSKENKLLGLTVKNEGPDCFIKSEILFSSGRDPLEFEISDLKENQEKTLTHSLALSDQELRENMDIRVRLSYGKRRNFLTKSLEENVELRQESDLNIASFTYPLIIAVLLIVIIVLVFMVLRKKEGKEKPKNRQAL